MKDYAEQILDGEGENDYTRYMRTDALLSLQRGPGEWVHRDEMLFQIVHQSTELWLKLACAEVAEATRRIEYGELDAATRLLGRAALGGQLVTQQLEMMRRLSPGTSRPSAPSSATAPAPTRRAGARSAATAG